MREHRVALRLAYDGTAFRGSQRQGGDVRTVEGEVLRALGELGAGSNPRELALQMASRTDAGVSAAGNVLALTTSFPLDALPRALNGLVEDVWVTGIAEVPDVFRPRHATLRRYRYILPRDFTDVEAFREALACFQGEHDLERFARRRGGTRDTVVEVSRVDVTPREDVVHVDVEGPSFLWNQVRRMVGAAVTVAHGEASLKDLEATIAGSTDRGFPPAPAEHLVLLGVEYDDVEFEPVAARGLGDARARAELAAERFRVLEGEPGERAGT